AGDVAGGGGWGGGGGGGVPRGGPPPPRRDKTSLLGNPRRLAPRRGCGGRSAMPATSQLLVDGSQISSADVVAHESRSLIIRSRSRVGKGCARRSTKCCSPASSHASTSRPLGFGTLAVRSISFGSRPIFWHHSSRMADLRAYWSGVPIAFHICACSATNRSITFSPPPPIRI